MADRYAVPFQVFITNGVVITSDVTGRVATAGDNTLTLSTTGGAGTFTITMGSGCTGTVTSGTAAITGSVVTLSEGANVLTADGAGTCTLALTLGTAANWDTVNTWSADTGGVSGASVPTSSDNTYCNANTFTAASQVLTVDAAAYCLAMDWTGATNTPTLHSAAFLIISGNATFITAMVTSIAGSNYLSFNGAGKTLTSNGHTFGGFPRVHGASLTLADEFNGANFAVRSGTFSTGNFNMTLSGGISDIGYSSAKTITLGSSIITTSTYWSFSYGGLTLTANTSTINCDGDFDGGGATTYNDVELTGATSTIAGSNTFAQLTFKDATTQTITFTDGTTQTAAAYVITGESGKVKTLTGTGAAGWFINKTVGSYIDADYLTLDYSKASPVDTWYAGGNSTDSGNNEGWIFTSFANRVRRGGGWWVIRRRGIGG